MRDIRVRLWAAAGAAAGAAEVDVAVDGPLTVSDLRARLVADLGERLAPVLSVCAVLVGDRPAGRDPSAVLVQPGDQVEFLPPYAGG